MWTWAAGASDMGWMVHDRNSWRKQRPSSPWGPCWGSLSSAAGEPGTFLRHMEKGARPPRQRRGSSGNFPARSRKAHANTPRLPRLLRHLQGRRSPRQNPSSSLRGRQQGAVQTSHPRSLPPRAAWLAPATTKTTVRVGVFTYPLADHAACTTIQQQHRTLNLP